MVIRSKHSKHSLHRCIFILEGAILKTYYKCLINVMKLVAHYLKSGHAILGVSFGVTAQNSQHIDRKKNRQALEKLTHWALKETHISLILNMLENGRTKQAF
jgi:hypothetical protein